MHARTGAIGRVPLGDVAKIEFGYKEPTSYRRYLGEDTITLRAVRKTGANVIEAMKGLRAAVEELNEFALPSERLNLTQVYDETVYIKSAIDLVQQNIWVGGTLAALILMLFLRSFGATLVITLSIPVSVVGAFVAMAMLGRSINVISLAGIAFSVGMVVDAAIVVLENIYRHRQLGRSPAEAAYRGTKEVWPAVVASALTTVVVFAPILLLELQVGQLFRDIAVAISVAVMLSLVVSATVIPALSKRLLKNVGKDKGGRLSLPVIDPLARGFVAAVMAFTRGVTRSKAAALVVIAVVCGGASVFTLWALPPLDFLPDGNRNFVWGHITPPPGYNLEATKKVAERIEDAVRPLWSSVSGPESKPGEPPKIKNFFFIARNDRTFIGAIPVDPPRAGALLRRTRHHLTRLQRLRGHRRHRRGGRLRPRRARPRRHRRPRHRACRHGKFYRHGRSVRHGRRPQPSRASFA